MDDRIAIEIRRESLVLALAALKEREITRNGREALISGPLFYWSVYDCEICELAFEGNGERGHWNVVRDKFRSGGIDNTEAQKLAVGEVFIGAEALACLLNLLEGALEKAPRPAGSAATSDVEEVAAPSGE